MANNWQINMIAVLDENSSRSKINDQIDQLKGKLKEVSLNAKIDSKTASSIQSQLDDLKVSLSNIKIDDKALNNMISQVNNALKGIQIPNISIGNTGKQVQKLEQEISNGFKQGTNAVEQFKKSLVNAGKSSSEIEKIVEKVELLKVNIDSLKFSESSIGSMKIDASGIDEFGNKVKITQSLVQDLQTMDWNIENETQSIISTKEIEKINNAFADYTSKFAQFKSINSEILSGLEKPLSDFENKLSGLKSGISTIDEVKNSFKTLNTEASNITANFSRQLSPIDSAINNLAKGEETIAGLKAEFKGLNNAPEEINKELNKCTSLLNNIKKIESQEGRTSNWSEAYREWASSIDLLKAKLVTLKKEQSNVASTQVYKISDLKDNNIAYMSKVYNTIENQMERINQMARGKGWNIIDISGVERSDGLIKKITLTIRDAEGALKKLDMQREKLQGEGKAQDGLMQVGDIKIIETAIDSQNSLAESIAKVREQSELARKAELERQNIIQNNAVNKALEDEFNQRQKINLSIGDNGKVSTDIELLRNNFYKLGMSTEEVKIKMSDVDTAFKQLKSLMKYGENSEIIEQFNKLNSSISQTNNELKITRSEYSLLKDTSKYIKDKKKAQDTLNESIKKGKELANQQSEDRFISKQSSIYEDIKNNQKQIYSLKQKLLSADELETEEINKQINALELKNKYNNYKLNKNGMIDNNLDKSVQQSKEILENQYRLVEARKVDSEISKESINSENQRAKAIKFTRDESERLAESIKKYSYGDTTEATNMIKQMDKGISNFGNMSNVQDNIDKLSSAINKIINDLKTSHEQSLNSLNKEIETEEKLQSQKDSFNNKNINAIDYEIKKREEEAKSFSTLLQAQMQQRQNLQSEVNDIKISIGENGKSITEIETLRNNFAKLGLSADEVKSKMSGVDEELKQLKSLMDSGAKDSEIINQFNKLKSSLLQTQNDLKSTRSSYSLLATEQQRLSLANDIESWNQKNTKATKEVREENQRYIETLRDLDTQMTKVEKNNISIAFKENENSMRSLNRLGASLKDQFKQAANSFTQWISVSSVIMGLVYNVKEAVSELKELDTILTEISKTSDLTESQLQKLGDTSFETASKYGVKASDYLTGVQEMYRAGFDNAEQMAELSVLAQSAGDMSIESANDYLMATNAAYEYKGNIEKLNNVLDRQNYVTNNAAVSMQDMADATSEAASISAQYGVSIEDLSSMIATIASKTRETGSEVGNALNSIFVTLQDTSSKAVTDTFDMLGISMTKLVNGTEKLKTPIELLRELATVFNSLEEGDTRRSAILTEIGKKYHSNSLAALLGGWADFEGMQDLYNNPLADGSAFREAEKSLNSLQGLLNTLSNTWTDTVHNIVNSDTLKTGVNFINTLLTGVNKLTDSLGLLGTVVVSGGLVASLKNIGKTYEYTDLNNCFEYALYT